MSQEIHITVPKGAKVVIHEEGEPEAEAEPTLEEMFKQLMEKLNSQPNFILAPMPYPIWYVPYAPPHQPLITWTVTNTSGTISQGAYRNDQTPAVYLSADLQTTAAKGYAS